MRIQASVFLLVLGAPLAAQAAVTVSPVQCTAAEGASANAFPFTQNVARRYMQLHSDLGAGVKIITKLSFRMNGAAAIATYTGTATHDLALNLGDSVPWNAATGVISNNWIGTPTAAVARKILTWGPQGTTVPGGPNPFVNMDIPLDAPYTHTGVNSIGWEAVYYAYALVTSPYNATPDVDVGSITSGVNATTGTGCIATGRTAAMTHTPICADVGGSLLFGFSVANGPNSAPTVLNIGISNPNLTVPGLCGNLYTDLVANIALGTTTATGAIPTDGAPAFMAPNVAPGGKIYTQAHSLDVGRIDPIPVCNSNGVSITFPTSNLTKVIQVTRLFNTAGGTTATNSLIFATSTAGYGIVTQFTH